MRKFLVSSKEYEWCSGRLPVHYHWIRHWIGTVVIWQLKVGESKRDYDTTGNSY